MGERAAFADIEYFDLLSTVRQVIDCKETLFTVWTAPKADPMRMELAKVIRRDAANIAMRCDVENIDAALNRFSGVPCAPVV